MRLIDNDHGHLFMLPPPNVILLAPRRRPAAPPVQIKIDPAPISRSLVVHGSDGSSTIWTWVKTRAGWRREG